MTVTIVLPALLVSCAEVAVIVSRPAVIGAVNRPEESTFPELALQVTAELKLPVPVTDAAHCEVCPVCTAEGLQVTETAVMVGLGGVMGVGFPPPPPQDTKTANASAIKTDIITRRVTGALERRAVVSPDLRRLPR